MGDLENEVTQEYIDAVAESTKDVQAFQEDEDLVGVLASTCWRQDWPFPKAHFEEEYTVNFSDEDVIKLEDFISKTYEYADFLEEGEVDYEVDYMEKEVSNNFSESLVGELGLRSTASESDVLTAIRNIKKAQFSEEERKTLTDLKKDARISFYSEELYDLTIAGNKDKMAETLYNMENKMGVGTAREHLSSLQDLSNAAVEMGVTEVALKSRNFSEDNNEPSGEVEMRITKFAEANKVSIPVALATMSMTDPTITSAWQEELKNKN